MNFNKTIISKIIIITAIFTFTSCATALNSIPTAQRHQQVNNQKELLEFIGFKNDEKVTNTITTGNPFAAASVSVEKDIDLGSDNFGEVLESLHLAVNRQHFYTGIYSLQELEMYKSSTRFVSFVEVQQQRCVYSNYSSWMFAPLGKFNKTFVQLVCEYRLYIYDTETKKIVYTAPIKISENDAYNGCYDKSSLDERESLVAYYATLFSNTLIDNYSKAYNYLQSL